MTPQLIDSNLLDLIKCHQENERKNKNRFNPLNKNSIFGDYKMAKMLLDFDGSHNQFTSLENLRLYEQYSEGNITIDELVTQINKTENDEFEESNKNRDANGILSPHSAAKR